MHIKQLKPINNTNATNCKPEKQSNPCSPVDYFDTIEQCSICHKTF